MAQKMNISTHAAHIAFAGLVSLGMAFLIFPALEQPLLVKLWLGALLLTLNIAVLFAAGRMTPSGKINQAELGLALLAVIAIGLDYAAFRGLY